MKRTVAVLLLVAILSGCVSEPGVQRVDLGGSPEKQVLAALTKVSATQPQKVAILNAYDSRNGELRALSRKSKEIIDQWYKLDRTAPDYLQQVDALAVQWAQVNGDEMKARAGYEHEVAATLSPKQWSQWQDYIKSTAAAQRRAELYNEDGVGGRRGRE